jgi:hypothetical protein
MSDAPTSQGWLSGGLELLGTFTIVVASAVGYHWRRLDRIVEQQAKFSTKEELSKVVDNQVDFITKTDLALIFGRMNEENDRKHQQNIDSFANLTTRIDRALERMK